MATKTVKKTIKKEAPIAVKNVQPKTIAVKLPNSFSLLKKNKKITIGAIAIVVIAVLIILAVLLKSLFVAAIVNGQPITRLSVINSLEKQSGKTVLSNLIVKQLIFQEAKKKNISVTQGDVDTEIKRITSNLQNQGSTLEQALVSQNLTMSDLNDEIKIQLTVTKIAGDIVSTQKEVDDFVSANKAQMAPGVTDAQFKEQAVAALKQQKLQTKIQELIKNLQAKANIVHFVSY